MTNTNERDIALKLASSLRLEILPVCVYGSEEIPDAGVRASAISDCVAESIFRMASGEKPYPLYVSLEEGEDFCRCRGGPAWFGYSGFDPDLISSMSTVSTGEHCEPKLLKATPEVAKNTYDALGKITPIGKYTVMRRCDDPGLTGCDVKCIIFFGTAGSIRDLCGLAHFRNPGIMNAAELPWGPSCGTLVTYPAGMSDKIKADRVFIGPVDPSARYWLDPALMAAGIPVEMARDMAADVDISFISKITKT
ncbi:DUF169 domain-containing protein [Methanooceanicella nereidis]|uniref:DUF169 domain-containing protein n=1 Tax=Methanooceanicella nereidis TaxID=2052831 RepID=UPI001E293551